MTTFSDPGFKVTDPDSDVSDEDVLEDELVDDEADLDDDVSDEELVDEDVLDEDELEANDLDETTEDLDEDLAEEEPVAEDYLDDDVIDDELHDDEPVGSDLVDDDSDLADDDNEPDSPADDLDEPIVAPTQVAYQPPPLADDERAPFWSTRQLTAVAQRVLAVLVIMGVIGYGLGALRGNSHIARAEFVYTLDESVPDSFLREDRRLLTQVVTFESDAVLTPVAEQFDVTVDELRAKIDVNTLDLSEVLRLDVSDGDQARAVAINQAVLNQYLEVITDASPAGNSTADLAQRRADVAAELAVADDARKDLVEAQQRDVALEVRENGIERQIELRNEQLNRIQVALDDALIRNGSSAGSSSLTAEYDATLILIGELEADLIDVGSERAALSAETTAEPALLREIDRLETVLTTIDDELSQRELAPLVASPIRELSDPVLLFRSRHLFGLQGMALGLMLGLPVAALVAYRARKQQLWFD